MNANSQAIIIFCSYISVPEGVKPLEPHEWSELAVKLMNRNLEPRDLLRFSVQEFISELECSEEYAQRLLRLMDRSAGLFSEVGRYADEGINIYTRADKEYPSRLKLKLQQKCPPMFYCAGDMSIAELPVVGYAGSRQIESDDESFTRDIVLRTCFSHYGVVSGGAKGVDSVADDTALAEGWPVIDYVMCGLSALLRKKAVNASVIAGNRLMLSASIPEAGFNAGLAMSRNKYIYAQAEAAVIVRSYLEKGGTWTGAVENLKEGWCPLFCRDIDNPGNKELIRRGAIAINDDWDGDITRTESRTGQIENPYPIERPSTE